MVYANFKMGSLTRQFSLTIDETTDLFADVPAVALHAHRLIKRASRYQTSPIPGGLSQPFV